MIALCFSGSKAWVICTALNILINPIRNLTIDVLLVGTIYNMIEQGRAFEDLVPFFVALALFYAATVVFEGFLYAKVEPNGSLKIQKHIDRLLCENAANVELAMFDNADFYKENIFAVENCVDTAKRAVNNTASFFAYLIGCLSSIGLIVSIEPLMAGFIVLSILLSALISNRKKNIDLTFRERRTGIQTRESYVHRIFYGREYAKELRSYPALAELNLKLFDKTEKENVKLTGLFGGKNFLCSLFSIFNSRVLMYWGVMLMTVLIIWFRGDVNAGSLLIMTVSIATAALLIGAITNRVPHMVSIHEYQKKFESFLSYSQKPVSGKKEISRIESICFEHVSFTYPNEERPALKDVSFTVKTDEHIVIVGLNGSGKSTIVKLLMGFYVPDSGKILINGVELQEYDRDTYISAIACVFQEIIPYALPVEKNITAQAAPADHDRMQAVLKDAGLSEILDEDVLKNEMTREFSEKGTVLSGGNMQKTAIARALYRDASLLVLDESTSAIDPETETKIMESISRAGMGRIIVQISHKLSCVKSGSNILYLEDGRIIESGTHSELLGRRGKYYELFSYQAEKFHQELKKDALRREVWE